MVVLMTHNILFVLTTQYFLKGIQIVPLERKTIEIKEKLDHGPVVN